MLEGYSMKRRRVLKSITLAGLGLAGLRGISGPGRAASDLSLPEEAVPSDVVALDPLPPATSADAVSAQTVNIGEVYRAVKSDGSFGVLIVAELNETETTYEYDVVVGLEEELEDGSAADTNTTQEQLEAQPGKLAFAIENLKPVDSASTEAA